MSVRFHAEINLGLYSFGQLGCLVKPDSPLILEAEAITFSVWELYELPSEGPSASGPVFYRICFATDVPDAAAAEIADAIVKRVLEDLRRVWPFVKGSFTPLEFQSVRVVGISGVQYTSNVDEIRQRLGQRQVSATFSLPVESAGYLPRPALHRALLILDIYRTDETAKIALEHYYLGNIPGRNRLREYAQSFEILLEKHGGKVSGVANALGLTANTEVDELGRAWGYMNDGALNIRHAPTHPKASGLQREPTQAETDIMVDTTRKLVSAYLENRLSERARLDKGG